MRIFLLWAYLVAGMAMLLHYAQWHERCYPGQKVSDGVGVMLVVGWGIIIPAAMLFSALSHESVKSKCEAPQ